MFQQWKHAISRHRFHSFWSVFQSFSVIRVEENKQKTLTELFDGYNGDYIPEEVD